VIGIEIDGLSRAYPLRVLNWHEVVNDRLGDMPVLITYNPLCDSAVVYERRMGERELTFGFSGLLYNSNTLIYDKQETPHQESLWSQLLGKAVSGTAARDNQELRVLPCAVVSWKTWKQMHPDTEVVYPEKKLKKRYKRHYGNYFGSDLVHFPVSPLPPGEDVKKKLPVVIVGVDGKRQVFSLDSIARHADDSGIWATEVFRVRIQFQVFESPLSVLVISDEALEIRYSFWFAWYALNPGVILDG